MWVAPDVHWVLGVLIGNVVGVAALTWLLMPLPYACWFAAWLRR